MHTENTLPYEKQFNTDLEECYDDAEAWAEEKIANNARDFQMHDILDVDCEGNINADRAYFLSELILHGELDELSSEARQQATETFYRGMIFGAQLVEFLYKENPLLDFKQYFDEMDKELSPFYNLLGDTQDYFMERPALDAFVGRYMPEIDPSAQYNHIAEIGAGLLLMLGERARGEEYVAAAIAELTPELFARPDDQ